MLTVLSPAKSLDPSEVPVEATVPIWPDDALRLAKAVRGLTLGGLRDLMGISADLARLNRDRFRAFSADPDTTWPAAFLFDGDTYKGLDAPSLDSGDLAFAQSHLRILSGLYGLLRPLDGIQPYRLEMGSRLRTRRGASLYDYWGDRIAHALRDHAAEVGTDTILNCASQEYFRSADRPALRLRVITPVFLEARGGTTSMVGFYAKRARGAMARFVVTHRLTDPEAIKAFDTGGYAFDPDRSDGDRWAFVRPRPEA